MAEQQEEPHSLASTFPNPPPFWKDFTPERIAHIEELRSKDSKGDGEDADNAQGRTRGSSLIVPADLTNLQPPPEPTDGRWRVFGDFYTLDDKLPSLEDQGIRSLPDTATTNANSNSNSYDRAIELKRLSKSLLLNFLELVGTLAHAPLSAEAKVADLRVLFINIHHVLNEYRPHQARESALELMGEHLDSTRRETRRVREVVDRARGVLEGLASLGIVDAASDVGQVPDGQGISLTDAQEGDQETAKQVWKEVDALLT